MGGVEGVDTALDSAAAGIADTVTVPAVVAANTAVAVAAAAAAAAAEQSIADASWVAD